MAEQDNPPENPNQLPQEFLEALAKLNPRQREFLRHYLNPQGPGFGNATKSAELTPYAGEPGSVQLSVQGYRVLNSPKVRQCMEAVFEAAGCTLELDAKVIYEGMTATRTRYLRGPDNTIIATPPEPDHPTRLRAVDLRHRLLRTFSTTATVVRPSAGDCVAATSVEQGLCPSCGAATDKVAAIAPADRGLLRAITNCDQELANSDAPQQRPGDEDGNSPAGENSC